MKPGDQIFAWTGPTPVGVGYASFLQAFHLGGLTRFTLRGGDGVSHTIDVPRNAARELAQSIAQLDNSRGV